MRLRLATGISIDANHRRSALGGDLGRRCFHAPGVGKRSETARLHFRFINEAEWWIEILPAPSFRFPPISEVAGVTPQSYVCPSFLVGAKPICGPRKK
jgi:hypothetical protein